MIDKELDKIIKDKGFKNFWELLDFLIMAGYEPIDSIGMALLYYNDAEVWENVAYGKIEWYDFVVEDEPDMIADIEYLQRNLLTTLRVAEAEVPPVPRGHIVKRSRLVIGMVNEENEHLRGMFQYYKKAMHIGKADFSAGSVEGVEKQCDEKYEYENLPEFLINYLGDMSERHYGYNVLHRKKEMNERNQKQNRDALMASVRHRE